MSEISEQVGQMIKEVRLKAGLTQNELGERLGVTKVTVTKYELGQNLTLDTLNKVAKALGVYLYCQSGTKTAT